MKRARALALLALLAGCSAPTELSLAIRLPADAKSLAAVTQVNLSAARDGVVLAQSSFPATANRVFLNGVSHGERTVITLAGVDSSGSLIARGNTCPLDFEGGGTVAPLYFAPTNFFASTAGAPIVVRQFAAAVPLTDGSVLIAGGRDASGAVLSSSESFAPGAAVFTAGAAALSVGRWRAEAVHLASIGALVTGGVDASGGAIAGAELYLESQPQFLAVASSLLDARVGHRLVVLSDGRALLSGGSNTPDGTPLATTLLFHVLTDGTYQVTQGPPLAVARSEHAATIAVDVPIVFGGYDSAGAPLASIENIDPAAAQPIGVVAQLLEARAHATASTLSGGSVLVVGGVGAGRAPLDSAELYNPVERTSVKYTMAHARVGHTATVLSDGRVLIAGGVDANGAAVSSVELFAPGVGFVTERSLGSARGDHDAVVLCDGTVLIVGGAAGAELYSGPAN